MILEAESLTKVYSGGVRALDRLTFSLPEGAIGLLGPNGAGKSTFVRAVLGLVTSTSGSIRFRGIDTARNPLAVRQQVGYMPETDCFVPGLNAVEYVRLAGQLNGMSRKDAMQRTHLVLNYVELGEERYRPVVGHSTGMKQKVKLAQALVHHPKLLLLDEPTSGLDPRAREEMLDLVRDIGRRGVSVVFSTHILPDVERTCDHVAILHRGRLLREGRVGEILRREDAGLEVRIKGDEEEFLAALREEGADGERLGGDSWRVTGPDDAGAALRAAARSGVQLRRLGRRRDSLDELFARTIGQDE
ncbi:MAG: ABC transporter ATP-binding protein [Planctomycetota bacterium]